MHPRSPLGANPLSSVVSTVLQSSSAPVLLRRFGLPLIGALLLLSTFFTPAEANQNVRTLRPRDTLVEIAAVWKTTPETLRHLNNLAADEFAWGGMKLVLPPDEGVVIYTAQAGDTPTTVAAAHSMSVAQFVEYNKVAPNSQLAAGKVYLVTSDLGLWASREVKVHTVAEGETVDTIAALYTSPAAAITAINAIRNPNALEAGTQLLVPERDIVEQMGNATRDENGYLQIAIEDFPTLTEKWVEIDLSHQRLTAYEGTRPLKTMVISSGKARTPTVTGVFRIWAKISSQTMSGGSVATGDYYNLPGVQWVSYFYKDYALHGAYWHNRFGVPTSHGCVNLTNRDAEWLYNWMAPENPGRGWYTTDTEPDGKGTLVVVHR